MLLLKVLNKVEIYQLFQTNVFKERKRCGIKPTIPSQEERERILKEHQNKN